MTTISAPPRDRILQGILLMCLAVACFSSLNGAAKFLSGEFPIGQIVWARYLGSLAIMIILFFPRHRWRLFRPKHVGIQVLRGFLLFTSSALYFAGISFLALSTAATISMTAPLLITALSVPFLGEAVGLRRWIAVLIGFIGALIVIRPGMGDTSVYILFVVGSTLSSTFYQLITRRYSGEENAEVSATIATLVGSVAAAGWAFWDFAIPANTLDIGLFSIIGVFAGVGHYLLTLAYQKGPAAVIAPFSYTHLIGATIFGYILFDDFPDRWTWIGAAIIMGSGLYIAHRERLSSRRKLSQ